MLTACGAGSDDYAQATANIRRPLDAGAPDAIAELVRFATLAGNGHNTQPWRFVQTPAGVDILPDMRNRAGNCCFT